MKKKEQIVCEEHHRIISKIVSCVSSKFLTFCLGICYTKWFNLDLCSERFLKDLNRSSITLWADFPTVKECNILGCKTTEWEIIVSNCTARKRVCPRKAFAVGVAYVAMKKSWGNVRDLQSLWASLKKFRTRDDLKSELQNKWSNLAMTNHWFVISHNVTLLIWI